MTIMTDQHRYAGHDLHELNELAKRLAVEAGELVESMRDEVDFAGETKSSATDVVTAADKAAEDMIITGLLTDRPDDGVLGEEGGSKGGSTGVRWLIDPIDGTTNYIYDIAAYCVSIAAEIDGILAVGVVYEPKSKRCYHGTRGGGSFVSQDRGEDVRLRVTTATALATSLVGTGFGYLADRRQGQAEVLLSLLPRIRDIRRFGSAALDLCFVAEGQLDAYYEKGLNPWDLAAGTVIAREAGALVGDLRNGEPSDVFTLAAGPGLFEALGDELRQLDADRRP